MDASCAVCGFVTTLSDEASGDRGPASWALGGAGGKRCFRAERVSPDRVGEAAGESCDFICGACGVPNRIVARSPALRPERLSAPPPLRRPPQHPPRADDDPTMMDLRSIAMKSFTSEVKSGPSEASAPARTPVSGAASATEEDVAVAESVRGMLEVCDTLGSAAAVPAPQRRLRALWGPRLLGVGACALAALAGAGLHALSYGPRPAVVWRGVAPQGAALAWALVSAGRDELASACRRRAGKEATATGEERGEGAASAREAAAAGSEVRSAPSAGKRARAAGARGSSPRQATAAPRAQPPGSAEAPAARSEPRSMSLVEAMAVAVGEKPPPP